jgi:hypothetical protein
MDEKELDKRIEELRDLLFWREYYKKYDRVYYNCEAILEVYLTLKKHLSASTFCKMVLKELLFTYDEKGV